jgi:hypothetical protein
MTPADSPTALAEFLRERQISLEASGIDKILESLFDFYETSAAAVSRTRPVELVTTAIAAR